MSENKKFRVTIKESVVIGEGGGISPSGTKTITENGTHNVKEYAYARVEVPTEGGVALPSLSNPGTAKDLTKGKQLIDGNGNVVTGTHVCSTEAEPVIKTLTISENGTYTAPSGVDGYSPITVEVPVPDGYVKPSGTKAITENGSFDVSKYATAKVEVEAEDVPVVEQATPEITVSNTGLITASATQEEGKVAAGTKSATKQLTTKSAATYTPGTSNKLIASGQYLTGAQTIKGDENLVAENIVKGKTIFGVTGTHVGDGDPVIEPLEVTANGVYSPPGGVDGYGPVTVNVPEGDAEPVEQATPTISLSSSGLITASATQEAGKVEAGTKTAEKQLTTQGATTYTPGTADQSISSGKYLTGKQTIKGDKNLLAANIKEGISIFGVTGTLISTPDDLEGDSLESFHYWEKYSGSEDMLEESEAPNLNIAEYVVTSPLNTDTIEYSAEIDTSGDTLKLKNPDSIVFNSKETAFAEKAQVLIGKYIQNVTINSYIYRVPEDATVTIKSPSSSYTSGYKLIISTAYKLTFTPGSTLQGIVISKNSDAYPDDEEQDGYRYVYKGTLNAAEAAPVVQALTISENGTYTVPEGVDGYSPITVEVPVPEGYLKPSGTKTITANGSYDVSEFEKATVNISTTEVPVVDQATPTIEVSSSGLITASATQEAGQVAAGTKSATKQLTTLAAKTYTPGTSDQSIASGKYLTGKQTIKGDSNLVAANIAKGVTIFGVEGSHEGGTSAELPELTDPGTADDLAEGKQLIDADGNVVEGALSESNPVCLYPDATYDTSDDMPSIKFSGKAFKSVICRKDQQYSMSVLASNFGNATAADVTKGKTFTSSAGLKVTGTKEEAAAVSGVEVFHITSLDDVISPTGSGTVKVYGFAYASTSTYSKTNRCFVGDGYYTPASSNFGSSTTPTKTSATFSIGTDGKLSGLPDSSYTTLDLTITVGE